MHSFRLMFHIHFLQPDFGIVLDIDGVLARGLNPIEPAKRGMRLLRDYNGNFRVPVAFVTNSCSRIQDKAALLEKWFKIPVYTSPIVKKWVIQSAIVRN